MGGHHLQRIVDVGQVRTFVWCGRCAGLGLGEKIRQAFKGRQ